MKCTDCPYFWRAFEWDDEAINYVYIEDRESCHYPYDDNDAPCDRE